MPQERHVERARREVVLLDGRRVVVRPIEPGDAGALVEFHERLSTKSVHNRFFGVHAHLTSLEASAFATVDHRRRMALVALDEGALVAVARYEGLDDESVAEVAFVVADRFQRQGLGTILLALLVEHARANGYARFVAQTLAMNFAMRNVFAHSGLSPLFQVHRGIVDVVLELGPLPVDDSRSPARSASSEGPSALGDDGCDGGPISPTQAEPGDLGGRVAPGQATGEMIRGDLVGRAGRSPRSLEGGSGRARETDA